MASRERILQLLESALVVHQQNENSRHLATAHLNLGRALVVFEEWEIAEEHLHHALEQFRAIDNVRGLALAHEAVGHLYLQLGQQEEARRAFRSARRKFAYLQDGEGLRRIDAVMP